MPWKHEQVPPIFQWFPQQIRLKNDLQDLAEFGTTCKGSQRVCSKSTATTSKTSKTSNRCKSDLFRCGQLPGSAHSAAAPGHTQQPLLLGVTKASRASVHEEIRRAFNDSKYVHLETDLPKIPKCRATCLPQTQKTSDFEDKGAQLFCFLCCFQGPSHVMLIAELAGTRHLHAAGEFTYQVRVCFS